MNFGAILFLTFVFSTVMFYGKEKTGCRTISKIESILSYRAIIKKVTVDSEHPVGKIKSVIPYNGKIFELDRAYYKIMVFNGDFKFLYSIGKAGQGPGELYDPIDFKIYQGNIFIMNSCKRIEVYSVNGNFIKTIKLKFEKNKTLNSMGCNSFNIYDNKIYVYYFLGKDKVILFDKNGNHIKTLIKREGENSEISPGKNYLVNFRKIFIEPSLKYLILSSYLDGSVEVYDLKTGRLLLKFKDFDKFIINELKRLKKYSRKRKRKAGVIASSVLAFFYTAYNPFEKSVWNIRRKRENENCILYSINLKEKTIKKIFFRIDKEIEIICFFFPKKNSAYFVDDNYDIYNLKFGGKK